MSDLAKTIDDAFEKRNDVSPATKGAVRDAVESALDLLDNGEARVAEKQRRQLAGQPVAEEGGAALVPPQRHGPDRGRGPAAPAGGTRCRRSSTAGARTASAPPASARCRAAIVRRSAYIAPNVVLMPSFVNLGAYVDSGTMVDTWATVGSCAQIGKNCTSRAASASAACSSRCRPDPVIIEDNCFIGARSEVAEGVIVREGSVLSMGVFIGASTKIVDRDTGEIFMGEVPAYSVVVPGTLPGKPMKNGEPGPSLYCAVIVKRVDEQTRAKTWINELLRD